MTRSISPSRALVVAGLGLLAVAVLLAAGLASRPSTVAEYTLAWRPRLDPSQAQTATMIVVDFVASECDISVAPGEMPGIIGPVVSPEIVYSPTSVTITLHASDGPGAISCNGVRHETEIALGVRLREPLSGRTLLDGSTSPPELRSYR